MFNVSAYTFAPNKVVWRGNKLLNLPWPLWYHQIALLFREPQLDDGSHGNP